MQPGSQLSINAVEGYPLEDFNPDVCFPCSLIIRRAAYTDAPHRPFDRKSARHKRSPEVAEVSKI